VGSDLARVHRSLSLPLSSSASLQPDSGKAGQCGVLLCDPICNSSCSLVLLETPLPHPIATQRCRHCPAKRDLKKRMKNEIKIYFIEFSPRFSFRAPKYLSRPSVVSQVKGHPTITKMKMVMPRFMKTLLVLLVLLVLASKDTELPPAFPANDIPVNATLSASGTSCNPCGSKPLPPLPPILAYTLSQRCEQTPLLGLEV
jgi:hypothetical protein